MQNLFKRISISNGFQKYHMNYAQYVIDTKEEPSLLLPAFQSLNVN